MRLNHPTGGDTSRPTGVVSESKRHSVARATAGTVPWVMGTLAASMREEGHGLHPSQMRLLMAMHHGDVSPSDLAERMEVSLPTVSNTLGVLERRGWIERAADDADRRRVVLRLTAEGRDMMRAVLDRGIEQLADVLSSATAEELNDIDRGMTSLQAVLRRAHPQHGHRHCRRAGSADGAEATERDAAEGATDRKAKANAHGTTRGGTAATQTEPAR